MGKPFPVAQLGPCLPPNHRERLETVKCVMEAEPNADPTLSEQPLSDSTAKLLAGCCWCSVSSCSKN